VSSRAETGIVPRVGVDDPRRYETEDDFWVARPIHVVWEITLACNLRCQHCGSRAGKARSNELNTAECLDVIKQLAELGTREITIIGGEAFIRGDWLTIIRAITDHGMDCSMQSGGYYFTEKRLADAAAAGLKNIGISIDGLAELHDALRGITGSFDHAFATLRAARRQKVVASVNTQIGPKTIHQLRELQQKLFAVQVRNWQVQLTVAMGNAADDPSLLLQPYQLIELMPLLSDLYDEGIRHGMLLQPGNNVGYFGPYERKWRRGGDGSHFLGCTAGHTVIGIESDGAIKGCPSLPTSDYVGGNIREMTISDIWKHTSQLRFTRERTVHDLWGYCRTCYYADVCRAGCTWTAHVLFGRPGNNPYCHHRALELRKLGQRERIVKVKDADGNPFDYGRFEISVENIYGDELERISVEHLSRINDERHNAGTHRVPVSLDLCESCNRHVWSQTRACPFCGADVAVAKREHEVRLSLAVKAAQRLKDLLKKI
jgi:Y-X(10)_GDL-associated radical SAM protein